MAEDSHLSTSQAVKRVALVLVLAITGMGICIAPSILKTIEIHRQTVRFNVPVISKKLDYKKCKFFDEHGASINPDKSVRWDCRNAYKIKYGGQDFPLYNDQTAADQLYDKYCNAQSYRQPQIIIEGKSQALDLMRRVLLSDGRVFLCGATATDMNGNVKHLPDTWLLDASGTKLSPGPKMQRVRESPTVIRLADGRVLISGGDVNSQYHHETPTLEIFDPGTNQINTLCNVRLPRIFHEVVEIRDGQILILGGMSNALNKHTSDNVTPLVEFVDVNQRNAKVVGQLDKPRTNFRIFKMPPDKILLLGGSVAEYVRDKDDREDLVDILTLPKRHSGAKDGGDRQGVGGV